MPTGRDIERTILAAGAMALEAKLPDSLPIGPHSLLRQIVDSAPYYIYWKDVGLALIGCNRAFAKAAGFDHPQQIVGKTDFELPWSGEETKLYRQEDRRVMGTGKPRLNVAETQHRADGRVMTIEASRFPLRDDEGNIVGLLGFYRELTDQTQAERELRESEARFRQATRLAKLGHCLWDSTIDRCLYCSDEYARIHGVSPEEYIARATTPDGTFNHPDDRDAYRAAVQRLRRGEPLEMEYRIVTPTGEVRHVRELAEPLSDGKGSVIQELCTIQDISDMKEAEERLHQAQKMEAVGQLTGGVAHDFNNLLAVIQGNAELLADEVGRENPLRRSILRAARRGAELTQGLLAFSRRQPLQPRPTNLAELMADTTGLLTRTLGETIEVETVAKGILLQVMADPGQLENALLNLAINARDAMPGGGKLSVECQNVRLDEAYLARHPEAVAGDYVVLAVADNGTGMPPGVQAQAFEPFFTTKEVGEGSGLGLSMVYGFAKQSGGHVSIDSEEGRGTTVKLYLPRAAETSARGEAAPRRAAPGGGGERILVLEDDADVRGTVVTLLKGLRYQVTAVANARQALAVLDAEPVDLVLSDVVLPGGMSGPEFAEAARERHPGLQVIFMSGYLADAAKGNRVLGTDRVLLNKPFKIDQLTAALRQALEGR